MTIERRKQERFSLSLQVKISAAGRHSVTPLVETVTANISTGGAFLETDHHFPIASRVRMEFLVRYADLEKMGFIHSIERLNRLSDNRVWICATGIVIRQEANGIAIIFETNSRLRPLDPPS